MHSGAYMPTHHDAEGLATYVITNCRAKIWVLMRPKLSASICDQDDLFDAFELLFDKGDKTDHSLGGCILLEPGDIL